MISHEYYFNLKLFYLRLYLKYGREMSWKADPKVKNGILYFFVFIVLYLFDRFTNYVKNPLKIKKQEADSINYSKQEAGVNDLYIF